MSGKREDVLVLFDVDGTLTPSRLKADDEMVAMLRRLREKVTTGFVGGSDLAKQKEQLGDNVLELFDYGFPENGTVAYYKQEKIAAESIATYLGEDGVKEFVNFCLHYTADLDIPKKRGTFVEFRNAMINLCPVGRNCSQAERIEFFEYDKEHKIRENYVKALEEKFGHLKLKFSIGGQISIDAFPIGWDKTYCLRHVEGKGFKEIHFFGDKTEPGQNDYEIYNDERTIGHRVETPEDTKKLLKELFGI